jgi:hypothetical protein
MVIRNRWAAAAAVGIPLLLLLVLFYPTQERQVKKRFKVLRGWVRLEGTEPPVAQVGKYRSAQEIFADPVELESKAHELSAKLSVQEIAGGATRWRSSFRTLDVEFKDLSVTFPSDEEALVTTTAHLFGESGGGTQFNETHEVQCTLHKGDKGWLFARIEVVQVLER